MLRFMDKATVGVMAALMLIGLTSSVYGFPGSYGALTRTAGSVQLTGRIVCTDCTLEAARKTQPRYSNHLYRITQGQQPAVLEVLHTTNATWLNHLMMPHVRLQGDTRLLLPLTHHESVQKNVDLVGYLLDGHTLAVQEVTIR